MEKFQNKALKLASDALNWTDQAIQEFTSLESLPEPLDCKPGCHFCCYNLPMVTPPEALLIGHHLDQTFTDQQKQTLNTKIQKILKKIAGKPSDEIFMMRHELPCIFLKESMCLIYEVRPAVCRTCTSTSTEHCKMIFETRNHRARLRCYQQIRELFHTVQTDLVNRSKEMGCQTGFFYVAETMKDYFRHPEPIDAWLQGEMVFHRKV